MADEKKDKKDAGQAKEAEQAPAAESKEKAARNPKIGKLSLAEIEKKIGEVQGSQGGLHSRYARQLLKRRDVLKTE